MRKTFQHQYQDGVKVTLSVSTDDGQIAIACEPPIVAPEHMAEHVQWRDEVVLPALMESLEPELMATLIQYALGVMSEGDQ